MKIMYFDGTLPYSYTSSYRDLDLMAEELDGGFLKNVIYYLSGSDVENFFRIRTKPYIKASKPKYDPIQCTHIWVHGIMDDDRELKICHFCNATEELQPLPKCECPGGSWGAHSYSFIMRQIRKKGQWVSETITT